MIPVSCEEICKVLDGEMRGKKDGQIITSVAIDSRKVSEEMCIRDSGYEGWQNRFL